MYCKDCTYWDKNRLDIEYMENDRMRMCHKIPMEMDKQRGDLAVACDGSDYIAYLKTDELFGCVQFEPYTGNKSHSRESV